MSELTDFPSMATLDAERARIDERNAAMQAEGVAPYVAAPADYFAFGEVHRCMMPDGISWVEHKSLNEGERRQYLKATNRDVMIEKGTGNARMRLSPGEEKVVLLEVAITGWNFVRAGQPVQCTKQAVKMFLEVADPKVVDHIHKAVTKANPWLLAELSIEDIDREIEALQEQRRSLVEAEQGKASSLR